VAAGLGDALFVEVSRQLETAGFMVEAGTLIDASLVQAAVRRPPNGSSPKGQESRSPHDPDADRTRTACGTKRFFGDNIHVGVDQGSVIIRSRMVAPAGVHESEVADDLVIGDEKAVYADKAYGKRARRETPKARGIEDRTQHRRVRGQLALPPWQAMRNKLIGRVRTAVEHIFSELKRGPYGFVRMRYRGLTRCRLHFDLSVIACNLRRAAG
jgi:IS5 family transposase